MNGSGSSPIQLKGTTMPERYRLSFTTGGLYIRESIDAIGAYQRLGNWASTRAEIIEKNLFQVRTKAASVRTSREVVNRLATLTPVELTYLADCSNKDAAHILWIAATRRYKLIQEFARDVLRENFLLLKRKVTPQDFEAFLSNKAVMHPEVDGLAKATQKSLCQRLFKMMKESGFIDEGYFISQAVLSVSLVKLIAQNNPEEFQLFPVTDDDIKRWLA